MVAPRPRIVVLTGPTAAGKTGIAVALAEQLDAEIVSADSQQVYRFMDVGTAKPTAEQRARVPHHLIDVVDPDVQYDAARYAVDAARAIDAILSRGHAVLVVGGTGLYIRAALEGLTSGPGRDPELRARLDEEDATARSRGDTGLLHRRLAKVDPETAERLHPNDKVRLIRALEIQAHTGQAASERTEKPEPRYDALQIAIDPGREPLIQRIDARCDAMIEGGLLQEVRALRERGYGPELPSMRAIGYRHMQPVVDGLETLATVREQMKHDTRQFARRQRTWLRRVEGAMWCRPEETSRIRAEAVAWLAG
jgi:tRNA dimethylallyltransferase